MPVKQGRVAGRPRAGSTERERGKRSAALFRTLDASRLGRVEAAVTEERRLAEGASQAFPDQVLFQLGRSLKEFSELPDPEPGSDEPIALVPMSRWRARNLVAASGWALSQQGRLEHLRRAVARAVLAGRDRTGSELKNRRVAMRQLEGELLRLDLSGKRRQSRFHALEIASTYQVLTRSRGVRELAYRHLEAIAEGQEPMTVRCPVSDATARKHIARLFGFASASAVLRYLIEVRKNYRTWARGAGQTPDMIASVLADLPYEPGDARDR